MSAGVIDSACAMVLTTPPGCCVPAHISSLPSLNTAVAFGGSIGAWARNGYSYAASTTLAADPSAASGSPSLRVVVWGASFESSSALFENAAVLSPAVGPSSQVTWSCLRAFSAYHQLSATMATPLIEPPPWLCGTMKACLMPGIALIASRLALTALPPMTGDRWYTA